MPDPRIEKAKVVKPYNPDEHHYDQDKPTWNEIKPRIEKAKVVKPYNPDEHHYDQDKPTWNEIKPGHFIWANNEEMEHYRKIVK